MIAVNIRTFTDPIGALRATPSGSRRTWHGAPVRRRLFLGTYRKPPLHGCGTLEGRRGPLIRHLINAGEARAETLCCSMPLDAPYQAPSDVTYRSPSRPSPSVFCCVRHAPKLLPEHVESLAIGSVV